MPLYAQQKPSPSFNSGMRPISMSRNRLDQTMAESDAGALENSVQHRLQFPQGSVTNARGQRMGVPDALGLMESQKSQVMQPATLYSDWGNNPKNNFGNPMSRVRQVYEPGLTREERQRRLQRFEGQDQAAAVRAGLLAQERVKGQAQVEAAQVKGMSDVATALAGQADTNRDGSLDPKERLALAEKWAKLEQSRLMDSLVPGEFPKQRPALPAEEAFAKLLQGELAKGQVRENPTNTDGFDSTRAFPDMNAQQPQGRVIQLPKENQPEQVQSPSSPVPGVDMFGVFSPSMLEPTMNMFGVPGLRAKQPDQGTTSNANPAPRGIQNSAKPNAQHVRMLQGNRNDPAIIKAFEDKFGRGSAAAYLGG